MYELLNDLRELGNYKKIFGFDGKYSADHPKVKFLGFWQNLSKNQQ